LYLYKNNVTLFLLNTQGKDLLALQEMDNGEVLHCLQPSWKYHIPIKGLGWQSIWCKDCQTIRIYIPTVPPTWRSGNV